MKNSIIYAVQAKKLMNLSKKLRSEAEKLNKLLSELGSSYSGKDAEVYRNVISNIQTEMKSIATEMDSLRSRLL